MAVFYFNKDKPLINVASSNWRADSDEEQLIGGQDFYAQAQKEREELIQSINHSKKIF